MSEFFFLFILLVLNFHSFIRIFIFLSEQWITNILCNRCIRLICKILKWIRIERQKDAFVINNYLLKWKRKTEFLFMKKATNKNGKYKASKDKSMWINDKTNVLIGFFVYFIWKRVSKKKKNIFQEVQQIDSVVITRWRLLFFSPIFILIVCLCVYVLKYDKNFDLEFGKVNESASSA